MNKNRGVVGYLADKGGDETRRPDEAKGEWRRVFSELRERIDALEAESLAVEDALSDVGSLLELSQPRGMYRELSVRWWRRSGHRAREPVLCRLEVGGRGGRLKVVEVDRRVKLRRDRGFGLGVDVASGAVDGYWVLRGLRDELREVVRELGIEVSRGSGRRGRVRSAAEVRLRGLRDEMQERLRLSGGSE